MPARRRGGGPLQALVLAAGKGKRMRSGRVKLLHVLGGSPMVSHVARAASSLRPDLLVAVIGTQSDQVRHVLTEDASLGEIRFVIQEPQLGTAHAVLQAERALGASRGTADLLILNGDVPLITPATLRALLRHHRRRGAAATVLTTQVEKPSGYGRIVRDDGGDLLGIVEQRDATRVERSIREINAGIYCADLRLLFKALRRTRRDNAQGEYYLPDIFPILAKGGHTISAYEHPEPLEVLGINDRAQLAEASRTLYRRRAEALMGSGVTIMDPDCTYIDPGVRVGRDSVIHPMARLEGATRIGRACTIGALAHIVDSRLGDGVTVLDSCVITSSRVADRARIGPFAHLRPGAVLENEVHVGNFVEVKKSRLGKGTKANHLTYLGDAVIGEGCNIGAGTITCNYDGYRKLPTVLEDGVFIGSDTQLVAPVTVRRGAYVGAGSTITKDVPEDALAFTRPGLTIREGWAKRRRALSAAKPPRGDAGRPAQRDGKRRIRRKG